MYEKYRPGCLTIFRIWAILLAVHPLELWLLDYLQQPGEPSLQDAIIKSHNVRREVYSWLMRTKSKNARDSTDQDRVGNRRLLGYPPSLEKHGISL